MSSLTATLSIVAAAFDRLKIGYLIGGSLASSARGVLRATIDVDILARVHEDQAEAIAAALGSDWYADPQLIRESIRFGRSFTIIHRSSGQKIDVFPATSDFHDSELARASKIQVDVATEAPAFPVATAEDILVAKLQWYAAGGEVSERQWSDVTGLIAANPDLDGDYVRKWSQRLAVEHLLARALDAARPRG